MGNKAGNLEILKNNNFLVPNFLVLKNNDNFKKKIANLNKNKKYAVRSNMLIEDSTNNSFAGQFKTFINVDFSEIISSIEKVIIQARNYGLEGKQISVIIQEYIEFNYSGIAFSRNPNGNREIIIEYHKGIGEDIVSGKVIPKKIGIYHQEIDYLNKFGKLQNILKQNGINSFIDNIKKIEQLFDFPQDIEWGINKGKIYFIQSRNITSISKDKYEEILFIEDQVENEKKYFYEKNEVSEIAPRPVTFTYSLLEKIYSKAGPIDKFYKKNNIKVSYSNPLQIIGNELYINKEKELQNIFPSFSYLKNNNYKISLNSFKGIFITIKNLYFLYFLKYDKNKLYLKLNNKLENNTKKENISESISSFIDDYSLIYKINFFTGKAFKKLETVLKNEKLTFSQTINIESFNKKTDNLNINSSSFIGNSLDIADESKFLKIEKNSKKTEVNNIWTSLPEWKKKFLTPFIEEAIFMQNLREKARYLTVKHITNIREKLLTIGEKKGLKNKKDIYFTSLEEILNGEVKEKLLQKRKEEFDKYSKYNSSKTLKNKYIENSSSKLLGISSGIVRGTIINKKTIKNNTGKKILLVDVLSPDLVEYFDCVEGIISKTGGLLSHLAILAREKGIPIVSGYYDGYLDLKIGDKIKIDGNEGKIVKF